MKGKTNNGHNNNDWGADVKYKVKAKIEAHDSGSKLKVRINIVMAEFWNSIISCKLSLYVSKYKKVCVLPKQIV